MKTHVHRLLVYGAVLGVTTLTASVVRAEYLVETLAQYEFPNLPEGIALDQDGDIYMSMSLTGEIRKRTPDGTENPLAMIATAPVGLAVDAAGDVYATLASDFPPPDTPPNPETHGVWKIQADGTAGRFATLPVDTFPNDVAIDESGNLFVSDSMLGKVYRISSEGTVEDWVVDPLLLGDPDSPPPLGPVGANGLEFSGSDLFVNNTTVGAIVRIPVQPDGTAGTSVLAFSDDPRLLGADGLAADHQGNLYVANIAQNTILRVAPEGTIDILADVNDGLDGPSSLEIQDEEIFFVNFGALTWAGGGDPAPSLMKVVIPEPSTFVLIACGLVCVFGYASRRMKHSRERPNSGNIERKHAARCHVDARHLVQTGKGSAMVWSTRLLVVATCFFVSCLFENATGRIIDDFSDGTDDGWTRHDYTEGTRYGPAIFDASTNSYHIASSPNHAGHNAATADGLLASWDLSAEAPISDGFVRATTRADGRSAHLSVVIRAASDGHGGMYGYYAGLCSTQGILYLVKGNGSSVNVLGTTNVGFRAGQEWVAEAGAVGNTITARAWRVDQPGSSAVEIRRRDSSFSEGLIGVVAGQHLNASSTFGGSFDDIHFFPPLKAGDADQDFDFDQFDLIQVQQAGKYLTGEPATWGEGDWNGAPSGYPESPPNGDGVFNQLDIVAAQQGAAYLNGSYEALRTSAVATPISVPEPATLPVLLAGGLMALAGWGGRRAGRHLV